VSKQVLARIIALMAAKVDIIGDFINKFFRLMTILRMIANDVLKDVIILVIGHKNPKSLKCYDRTRIIWHISTQQTQFVDLSYDEILVRNMNF
jgi:hypothetical protein